MEILLSQFKGYEMIESIDIILFQRKNLFKLSRIFIMTPILNLHFLLYCFVLSTPLYMNLGLNDMVREAENRLFCLFVPCLAAFGNIDDTRALGTPHFPQNQMHMCHVNGYGKLVLDLRREVYAYHPDIH